MLHICCAPDAAFPVRELAAEGWEVVGYFYGANIQPEREYRLRREALDRLAGVGPFFFEARPYDPSEWFERTAAFSEDPERGRRCAVCFRLQLEAAAAAARRLGCARLSSTLSVSPHKDAALIVRLGGEAAAAEGITWHDRVWRKGNGFLKSTALSRELGLYRQNYCGCLYSARRLASGGG